MGSLLQRLAAWQGYFSQMPRYYGAQIRGGGSAVKLHLDARHVSVPKDRVDILVCFAWDKYLELEHELGMRAESLIIYENEPPAGIKLPEKSFRVGLSEKSEELTGSRLNKNILALGLLKRVLGLSEEQVKRAIEEDRELAMLKKKISALEVGERLFSELALPQLRLSPPQDSSVKVVLHGNGAMARAAMRAGCGGFFGYPITPAAEIMQGMHEALSENGGVFLQAEDEIASAGLVVGASLAGVKAMTSTSGPGFDLMTEMMGLATAAEIPMVVIDVQRCGPSTGIPSKSEQSDLNHAIYGGHGDAPRVVMAPYDVEGCYRLVIEGFNIAQHMQTVAVVLSDQWLGQTFVAVDDEFLRTDYAIIDVERPAAGSLEAYHRYRPTADFISPMAVVGDKGLAYRTAGLTHNEKGAPDFAFETHQRMHDKRRKKLAPLCHRDDLVKVFGRRDSGRRIITWGSSAQVVLEAVRGLGLWDEIAVCVPELIHPVPERIGEFLRSAERLLVVEMNYSGQLHRYLRSEVDLPGRTEVYARAGGRPFSREELAGPITELAS